MSYIYGCSKCGTTIESPTPRLLRCSACETELVAVATSRWLFRCSSCGEVLEGSPSAEPGVQPCPFCDGGMMHPSRPA